MYIFHAIVSTRLRLMYRTFMITKIKIMSEKEMLIKLNTSRNDELLVMTEATMRGTNTDVKPLQKTKTDPVTLLTSPCFLRKESRGADTDPMPRPMMMLPM